MQSTKKRRLIVASGNAHKIQEIAAIFTDFEVVSQKQMGYNDEVEETGATFEENAVIKATAAAKALGEMVLADDSGLCVDALGGKPGVYSARYAGEHGNDQKNREKLLNDLQSETDRSAHFTSAIALVYPNGKTLTAIGETHGKILREEVGNGGFGYDCIFESADLQKSFGVATPQEKNSVSHRYRALQKMLALWQEYERDNGANS